MLTFEIHPTHWYVDPNWDNIVDSCCMCNTKQLRVNGYEVQEYELDSENIQRGKIWSHVCSENCGNMWILQRC